MLIMKFFNCFYLLNIELQGYNFITKKKNDTVFIRLLLFAELRNIYVLTC